MSTVSSSFAENLVDLGNALPHGSGINDDWTSEVTKSSIRFRNSYHCMDENGRYDGYADFTVVIPLVGKAIDWQHFKLEFNGSTAQRKSSTYELRAYLDDVIYADLSTYFE